MMPKKEKTPLFFRGEQLIINLFGQNRSEIILNAFLKALLSYQGVGFEAHVQKWEN